MAGGKHDNLFQRAGGDTYYARVQVPGDLVETFGRKEFKASLKTKDRQTAKVRLAVQLSKWHGQFEAVRLEKLKEVREQMFLQSEAFSRVVNDVDDFLPRVEMPRLSVEYVMLDAAGKMQHLHERPESRREVLEALNEARTTLLHEREYQSSPVYGLDHENEPLSAVPLRHAEKVEQFVRSLIDAEIRKVDEMVAKIKGEAPAKVTGSTSTDLRALQALWQREKEPARSSMAEMDKAIRVFIEATNVTEAASVTDDNVRTFKDAVLSLDRKSATKQKTWSMFRALLGVAVSNKLLSSHPMDGFTFEVRDDSVRREDFSIEDTTALLNADVEEEDRWLVRLLTFQGMRLDEAHQLRRADVRKEDGVWFLDINRHDGKSLKNDVSIRRVPLHREVLDMGFLEWLPKDGPLFDGTSAAASKRLNRAITKAGIEGEKTVHSLRHTFKTRCRVAGVSEEVHDRLTGHSNPSVGRAYGSVTLSTLKAAIDKVSFA